VRFLAALFLMLWAPSAMAAMSPLAASACSAITARVDAIPGGGPIFLRSWDGRTGRGPAEDTALAGAAFTYDNALAVVALIACGREAQAARIGEALLKASATGFSNAYRAGAQTEDPPPPNGWWSAADNRWAEDPYQVGAATGNVAWAGLALMALAERTGDSRWSEGAKRAAAWVVANAGDGLADGFSGGFFGYRATPRRLTWRSTEHNVDLVALFVWLGWRPEAERARRFVAAQWDEGEGRFLVGTLPDGSPNRRLSGLDAQLWPLLLPEASPGWRRAIAYVERAHAVPGGFDFNDDRDGLWVEGTAQAALVYRRLGRPSEAERLLAGIARQISPGGYLWATREARITTGLAIGPDSASADFTYERRPHLGATAWAALAALDWNPFRSGH